MSEEATVVCEWPQASTGLFDSHGDRGGVFDKIRPMLTPILDGQAQWNKFPCFRFGSEGQLDELIGHAAQPQVLGMLQLN